MPFSALEELQTWCGQWVNPVLGEVYKRNQSAGRELLARARQAADGDGASPDMQAARRLVCLRAEYYINRISDYPDNIEDLYTRTRRNLEEAVCPGPISAVTRARLLLAILVAADRDGVWELGADRFNELLGTIPATDRLPELWFEIAPWLFANNRVELLGEAYSVMLVHPMRVRQFPFRRIKLMYQIRNGTITTGDILLYLRNLEILNAANEFVHFFWPVLEELGLACVEVKAEMEATLERLNSEPPRSPYDPAPRPGTDGH